MDCSQMAADNREADERRKMSILDSIVEIYDNVNLINFVDNTETSLRDPEQKTHGIDMGAQTHTRNSSMWQKAVTNWNG